MNFTLDETVEVLERTPAVLDGLLRGIGPAWHGVDEGPATWSPFQVVGHLIHGDETDWLPRARTILEGADRAFAPFDRFAHLERYRNRSLDDLLAAFAELRGANLRTLRAWSLTEAQLALTGGHPELGEVTLSQLLATWAVHDLDHLGQIVRVMAKRYAEDVGPWRAYLSILER